MKAGKGRVSPAAAIGQIRSAQEGKARQGGRRMIFLLTDTFYLMLLEGPMIRMGLVTAVKAIWTVLQENSISKRNRLKKYSKIIHGPVTYLLVTSEY